MTSTQTAESEQPDVATASSVMSALRSHASDMTALFAADARLAGVSFVAMINGVVLSGLSLLTAWGLFIAMLVWWAGTLGLPMGLVFGALALLHVIVAFVLWHVTTRLARHLEFRATRRQLKLCDESR
jgi:TRAP-type C4-dicarboxylate transport system permease small subunit